MDLQDLVPKMSAFVLIALLLGVGLIVVQSLGTNYNFGWDDTAVYNKSVIFTNGTWVQIDDNVESCPADVWLANGSDVPTDQYECRYLSTQGGTSPAQIRLNGDDVWNGSVAINYSHKTATMAVLAINDTQNAIDDFPSWFAIIVVVLCAAVILGVVIKSFSGREMG